MQSTGRIIQLPSNSRVSRVHALSLDLLSCWTLTWDAMASVSTSNDLRGQLGVKSGDSVNQLVNLWLLHSLQTNTR